mmetsp:Transcript_63581/g.168438  ORF Transcript_63581/g.168438 Transcript_63581/m.168438 type:complete len:203 (+) Transcript_63581:637-1245(+)
MLLIRSSSARSGESSAPASLRRSFDIFNLLFSFSVASTSTQSSPFLISVLSCPVSSKSHLFRIILSAKANCSTDSFSAPSGFSSSRCDSTCAASTTVIIPSRRYIFLISSSTKKVCATGAGSAIPVVSIRTASNDLTRLWSRLRAWTKSPRTVQQMQPFITSITSSFVLCFLPAISFSSTPTSPNSFSMIAKRRPCKLSASM